jgi:2-oxoglutarate ferredoxin oxidoreductase subunit beta
MKSTTIARVGAHPLDKYLRTDRLPHIWCPGCGLGMILGTVLRAIDKSRLDIDKTTIVSGIGCTGRAAGYVKLDSFHVTHGRALPFATGLKIANPNLKVVVFSGDGDLAAIGGNHLIHAARRNIDMTVICVNNFIYGMTGGQLGPTTPESGRTTTSRKGNIEKPFNIPHLVGAAGAVYVARWTTAHVRQMERTFIEALQKKGFSFVEIISPCPTYYGRMNEQTTGLDQMRYYRYNSVVKHSANLADVDISLNGQIIVGNFIDIDRPYLPAPKGENGK